VALDEWLLLFQRVEDELGEEKATFFLEYIEGGAARAEADQQQAQGSVEESTFKDTTAEEQDTTPEEQDTTAEKDDTAEEQDTTAGSVEEQDTTIEEREDTVEEQSPAVAAALLLSVCESKAGVEVEAGKSSELPIQVQEDSILNYKFQDETYDFLLSARHEADTGEAQTEAPKEQVLLQDERRTCFEGSMKVGPGTIHFHLDNSFSWVNGKTIKYKVEVYRDEVAYAARLLKRMQEANVQLEAVKTRMSETEDALQQCRSETTAQEQHMASIEENRAKCSLAIEVANAKDITLAGVVGDLSDELDKEFETVRRLEIKIEIPGCLEMDLN